MKTGIWLEGLNEEQKQAVVHGSDPLLILAGDRQLHALFKGEDWQVMLREMLRITEHKQTQQEIRHVLAQVEKAVTAMRGR